MVAASSILRFALGITGLVYALFGFPMLLNNDPRPDMREAIKQPFRNFVANRIDELDIVQHQALGMFNAGLGLVLIAVSVSVVAVGALRLVSVAIITKMSIASYLWLASPLWHKILRPEQTQFNGSLYAVFVAFVTLTLFASYVLPDPKRKKA